MSILTKTRKHQDLFALTEMRKTSQKRAIVHECMRDEWETLSDKTLPLQVLLMAVTKMSKTKKIQNINTLLLTWHVLLDDGDLKCNTNIMSGKAST